MRKTQIKGLMLDMDGVLWRDTQPIGDLAQTVQRALGLGLKLAYVTNNATRTVDQYVDKFKSFGVEVDAEQIFTSARATADYLGRKYPQGGAVFIIGERGLVEALKAKGFEHGEENCLAVIVGLDRQINYEKLTLATLLVRSGVPLIGTNPDRTLPTPKGLVPGAGALIAALEAASGRMAKVIGKPESKLLEAALSQLNLPPEQALMVGDRLETDIAAGQKAGCPTALVLSGVSSLEDAKAWKPQPDYVIDDLDTLLAKIKHER